MLQWQEKAVADLSMQKDIASAPGRPMVDAGKVGCVKKGIFPPLFDFADQHFMTANIWVHFSALNEEVYDPGIQNIVS